MYISGRLQQASYTRHRVRRALSVIVGLAIVVLLPAPMLAQNFTWDGNTPYDNGENPSVAATSGWVVEVHQAVFGVGPLWYHTGQVVANGTVKWAASAFRYDYGVNPAITVAGTTIVEVHQATFGVGPLWSHTGQVQPDGSVTWAQRAIQYDYGINPAITAAGTTIVEEHQATAGVGPLWTHTGQVQANGSVTWAQRASQYDYGENPSLAARNGSVVEVHQATAGVGPLWYRSGQVQANGTNATVPWKLSYQYDTGVNPVVAFPDGPTVIIIEAHQATTGVGPLWYNQAFGVEEPSGQISWRNLGHYDNGSDPALGAVGRWFNNIVVEEVHQGSAGVGTLWNHMGYFPIIQ
jgi:hypothetical protein